MSGRGKRNGFCGSYQGYPATSGNVKDIDIGDRAEVNKKEEEANTVLHIYGTNMVPLCCSSDLKDAPSLNSLFMLLL